TSYVFSDSEPQPYVITGLEDGTKYFISIKSNCGDSYSAPIGPNYLFTLWDEVVDCPEVITPPYFNDFGKEVPFGWSSLPMDKPRAEFLECNTLIDADAEQITESSDNWGLFADNFSSGVDNVFAISFSFDMNQEVGLNVDNYVAMGPVDLTNASTAELKWKIRSYSPSFYQENYTVYISDTDEASDILASTTTFNETLTSSDVDQWNQRSLDLSSDVGKLVYVVFRHHDSYDNYFLGLDDIEITSETLSNKEFNINLSYYFNRATKSLELEALSHIKEVSIYDMNGRLINLETPNTLKSNIDFNDIPKGLYIVKAKTDQGFESIKVLNQ
ncbi:MAG: choice-of-anchor J domain-containing protein, partial [Flavobacteriaceae bacterium]